VGGGAGYVPYQRARARYALARHTDSSCAQPPAGPDSDRTCDRVRVRFRVTVRVRVSPWIVRTTLAHAGSSCAQRPAGPDSDRTCDSHI
jgi:hypothetical protein